MILEYRTRQLNDSLQTGNGYKLGSYNSKNVFFKVSGQTRNHNYGTIYILEDKKILLSVNNVMLIDFFSSFDLIMCIEYNPNPEATTLFGTKTGQLIMIRKLEEIVYVDQNVDSSSIIINLPHNTTPIQIFYIKYSETKPFSALYRYNGYQKERISVNVYPDNIDFYETVDDQIIIKYGKSVIYGDDKQAFNLNKDINIYKAIKSCNYYYFYFSQCPSKYFYIACEYAKKAYRHFILENMLENDTSENHIALFTHNQTEEVSTMSKIINNGLFTSLPCFKINGFSIDEILPTLDCIRASISTKRYKQNKYLEYDNAFMQAVEKTRDSLMDKLGILYRADLKRILTREVGRMTTMHTKGNYYTSRTTIKEIEEDLILQGLMPAKWKSELDLFVLVKKIYPKSVMHFTSSWLGKQHIDVYIPEIMFGIEYNGIQHYKAIDHFGGEEQYRKRIMLDEQKRQLCLSNGVVLIEWHYDEPVSTILLNEKLKQYQK